MRLLQLVILGVSVMACVCAAPIERLPIEDFARNPEMARARLSPQGKYLAYLQAAGGRTKLVVLTLASRKALRIDAGETQLTYASQKNVENATWVGNERLVLSTTVRNNFYGLLAIDADGKNSVVIGGYEDVQAMGNKNAPRLFARQIIHRSFDKQQNFLVLDHREDGVGNRDWPDVVNVRASDGLYGVVVKNPGEVEWWGLDGKGVVRLGVMVRGDLTGAIYRADGKEPWRTILPLEKREGGMQPIGFDAANERVFVAALTPDKRWTIFPLDPSTGQMGEALLSHPEYDILPPGFTPRIDGVALATPVFNPAGDVLLGVRYVTEAPRVKWFDRQFALYQMVVDRAMPDTVNVLVDMTSDGKKLLWLGYSDQHPGAYILLDTEKKKVESLGLRMSWIKPPQMAQMLGIKYESRDGLLIHGFLTVPPGYPPKGLPLVVMPHGGPWVRDVWGFDPEVQLLANRGYAVLQMDYRGSPGYGAELFWRARREIGRKIQDDIEDGTRWAIAAGVADPKRIAIFGWSYGGFSALHALGHTPELYRCGVSAAGVTDWPAIFNARQSDPDYREANRYWKREIGDPHTDGEFLREISPVNYADKIKAPVLIVQGKDDTIVPPGQARSMIRALENAGAQPESLFLAGEGHGVLEERVRVQFFTRLVQFLEQHLGPGVN
jgi:dipeptidyl aminopeptidase/acylaminoacyl peptidase